MLLTCRRGYTCLWCGRIVNDNRHLSDFYMKVNAEFSLNMFVVLFVVFLGKCNLCKEYQHDETLYKSLNLKEEGPGPLSVASVASWPFQPTYFLLSRLICPLLWSGAWKRSKWATKPCGPDSTPGVLCKVRTVLEQFSLYVCVCVRGHVWLLYKGF